MGILEPFDAERNPTTAPEAKDTKYEEYNPCNDSSFLFNFGSNLFFAIEAGDFGFNSWPVTLPKWNWTHWTTRRISSSILEGFINLLGSRFGGINDLIANCWLWGYHNYWLGLYHHWLARLHHHLLLTRLHHHRLTWLHHWLLTWLGHLILNGLHHRLLTWSHLHRLLTRSHLHRLLPWSHHWLLLSTCKQRLLIWW